MGFNLFRKPHKTPYLLASSVTLYKTNYIKLDTLKWNNQIFKQLSKEAKLIYCFPEVHCSTAGFVKAKESDIANCIGLEQR